MKLLSQDKNKVFEFEGTNLFIENNMILISNHVNIYEGGPNILGEYNNEKECRMVLENILEYYVYNNSCFKMPERKEELDERK